MGRFLVVSLLALALARTEAVGQVIPGEGEFCGHMSFCDPGSYDRHKVQGPAPGDGYDQPHGDCAYCASGFGPDCHFICLPPGGDLASNEAYTSIVVAAAQGDASTVMRLALLAPRTVRVNLARQSVQVMSCTGEAVIANLPAPRNQLMALQRQLAHLSAPTVARGMGAPSQ
jgi:hypothetical protein